jgi:hypothetical protein
LVKAIELFKEDALLASQVLKTNIRTNDVWYLHRFDFLHNFYWSLVATKIEVEVVSSNFCIIQMLDNMGFSMFNKIELFIKYIGLISGQGKITRFGVWICFLIDLEWSNTSIWKKLFL